MSYWYQLHVRSMIQSLHFKRAFWLGYEKQLVSCPILEDGTIQDWNYTNVSEVHRWHSYYRLTSYDMECLFRIHAHLVENDTGKLYEVQIEKTVA